MSAYGIDPTSSSTIDTADFIKKENTGDVNISSTAGEVSFSTNGVKRLRLTGTDTQLEGKLVVSDKLEVPSAVIADHMNRTELDSTFFKKTNNPNFVGDVDFNTTNGELSLSTNNTKRLRINGTDGTVNIEPGIFGCHVEGKLVVAETVQAAEGYFNNIADRVENSDTYVAKSEKNWLRTGGTVALGSNDLASAVHIRQGGRTVFNLQGSGLDKVTSLWRIQDKNTDEWYLTESDLTPIESIVNVRAPAEGYHPVQWSEEYASFYMAADNSTGTVIRNSSATRDSITSQTVLDFTRYNYEIQIKINSVSGSIVHFGVIENQVMIDQFDGGWFQVNYKGQGSQWGDGFSSLVCYPTATTEYRKLNVAFSRLDSSYAYSQVPSTLVAGASANFSIVNGVLTEIQTRVSDVAPWTKLDWNLFGDGSLVNSKLRFLPLKKYKLALYDGSTNSSSFSATVTFQETIRDNINEIAIRQPITPDIRRSEYYFRRLDAKPYYMSRKTRCFTVDTSKYLIRVDGPDHNDIEIWIEIDHESDESDYQIFIKHIGSINTLTLRSNTLTISPGDEIINPWCTTVFRIMKHGEEGNTNSPFCRKLWSDYNSNTVYFEPVSNLSNTRTPFWLSPYGVLGALPMGGWSGRFYIDRRAILTKMVIFGDKETWDTFVSGHFKLKILKEKTNLYASSVTGTDGDTVSFFQESEHGGGSGLYYTRVIGKSATVENDQIDAKFYRLNAGCDPDNVLREAGNAVATIRMGRPEHIIEPSSSIAVYTFDWENVDMVGAELKFYLYYQYI